MSRSFVILAVLLSATSAAATNDCPDNLAQRAESQADTLRTWKALYESFKSYRQCDDGAIAEGYSESVARILVDHWNTLPEFAQLQHKDAEFRRFVLKHIDATVTNDDVQKIRKKASAECPAGLRKLCADGKKQANVSLRELR